MTEKEIVLKFRRKGGGYARAMEAAKWMGLSIEDYLLKCIEEGHKLHRGRMSDDLELPAWLRRSSDDSENSTGSSHDPAEIEAS